MKEDPRAAEGSKPPAPENQSQRTSVTRRYRRALGGWWWLALVLVPLLLAGLTVAMNNDSDKPVAKGEASASPTSASTSASPSESSSDSAPATSSSSTTSATSASASESSTEAANHPFSISRTGEDVAVTATVASEAAKKELLDSVRSNAADGAKVVDHVTVKEGAAALPQAAALEGLLSKVKDSKDFDLSLDGATATLKGTVDSVATKTATVAAAKAAFPKATVNDQLTTSAAKDDEKTAVCDSAQLAKKAEAATAWFSTGSSMILPASKTGLNSFADAAKGCAAKDVTITLTGYTDNTGDAAINATLSKQRAEAVRQYLLAHGVKTTIKSEYKGAQNPIASNDTADGRAKNRRVVTSVK